MRNSENSKSNTRNELKSEVTLLISIDRVFCWPSKKEEKPGKEKHKD